MHQLQLYSGKEEPKIIYWITQEESARILDQINAKTGFVSIPRLELIINTKEIKSFGIPSFIKEMNDKGYLVLFNQYGRPVVQGENFVLEWDEDRWTRYETSVKRPYKTFEEFIGTVKQLNGN